MNEYSVVRRRNSICRAQGGLNNFHLGSTQRDKQASLNLFKTTLCKIESSSISPRNPTSRRCPVKKRSFTSRSAARTFHH